MTHLPCGVARVGLADQQWREVVDLYHVMEQINGALQAVSGWSSKIRKQQRAKMKSMLLSGRVDAVIKSLTRLKAKGQKKAIGGVILYISKRKRLMDYRNLKRAKLPIGSGAVESAVRRVINLRIKSPGIFWYEENAEAVMYLRAQALTGRWEATMERVRERARHSRTRGYKWEPTPMSVKQKGEEELLPLSEVKDDAA